MTDILIIAVVVAAVGLAALYIYKQKKRGAGCIGCPSGGNCEDCNGACSSNE
jgi:hypothetical protein